MEHLVHTYGYLAILAGTFLEGETILILGGFSAHLGYLNLGGVILAAFVGTLCGDQFCFYLGRRHGRATLARFPAWKAKSRRARRLLERHRVPVILTFRFLYGLRSVIPFAIGLSRIPASEFLILNALAAAVWAVAVGAGGYLFGHGVEYVLADVKRYETAAMLLVCTAGIAVWCGYFLWRRRRSAPESTEDEAPQQEC